MPSSPPLQRALFGPGSQPLEEDGAELAYPPMPAEMRTYRAPLLPDPDEALACPQGLRLLERLLERLADYRVTDPGWVLDVGALPDADRELVNQALGEGEVSLLVSGVPSLRAQETRLTGVWRVRSCHEGGQPERDGIEVAAIPCRVRDTTFQNATTSPVLDEPPPDGLVSARAILTEAKEQAERWRPGAEPYVINLTLLPHSEQDLSYLERALGQGPTSILSRGYGKCRITSTGLRNGWWVRHFNSDDRLILDTIEIVDLPAAALAAQEDFEDSAKRLAEIIAALR
ncbi:hydrogenase expression/formation protein [Thiocystis violacea]|uniref:hydrogenase expression/formation protein n=1 Tax=Thiocystis violacea TaxID=13725 RepID=UPI001907CF60|nr:hydrogenase expression/formation protein [Thiocystis violacea]MBK1717281.1 hydrogenase expression/formation protein [Thiocystis violacea]